MTISDPVSVLGTSSRLIDAIFFPSDDYSRAAIALSEGSPFILKNSTAVGEGGLDLHAGESRPIVSDDVRFLFEIVVYTSLCGIVSFFGIVSNVINLLVFYRQGIVNDSVTVTLTGLAVADLCSLATMLWMSTCYAIIIVDVQDLIWDPLSVFYVTAGWPHVMFTRVTCWMTAFLALERCLCVIVPFKVHEIITPRRCLCCVCGIFMAIMLSYIPIFYTNRLAWLTDPSTNTTILILSQTPDQPDVERKSHMINDVILPTASLTTVMVCSKLTISRLHVSTKWRSEVTSNLQQPSQTKSYQEEKTGITESDASATSQPQPPDNIRLQSAKETSQTNKSVPKKEGKVIRMVTVICIIFLICNSPCIMIIYLRFGVPEIAHLGQYHNLFHVLYSMDFFLESMGSSINIFVYYSQSSKYKCEFRALFRLSPLSQP